MEKPFFVKEIMEKSAEYTAKIIKDIDISLKNSAEDEEKKGKEE